MATGFVFSAGAKHTQAGHPEFAGRTEAIWEQLSSAELMPHLVQLPTSSATAEQLARVHHRDQIYTVKAVSQRGGGMIGGDTYVTAETWDETCLAAGSTCATVDAVLSGQVDNAAALVRPPGHHAGHRSIEGFCLFNNIAVAARHAQAVHGVERVAIVDFDVHHGNGTQDIFYEDESVQFFSTHQFSRYFYPGSGSRQEDGRGKGAGHNINIPLPIGTGDQGYAAVFDQVIEPLLDQFVPQLLLVSIGFDAHWRDPLAQMKLSLTGYDQLVRRLLQWSERLCGGKIVFVLEGGYDLQVLSIGVQNLMMALLQHEAVDPLGGSAEPEPDLSELIVKLRQQHLLT
ncbi:MAG: histone deacetylase [Candidatus Promineifilaceae bacterium]